MKKVVVSVTNDLVTDQRVKRSIEVLLALGYDVTFVGRKLPESMPVDRPYRTVRFKLWFRSGFLFYATYNIRLFFFLLGRRYDLYLSNDLDTLLPNYIISRWKGRKLVYDSHEYFTGVPEIQERPFVKRVWKAIENQILPKVKYFITVNESIARLYRKDYGVEAVVVRNISDPYLPDRIKSRAELGLPEGVFLLINQGSGINVDRGMEEMLEALKSMDDCRLLLVGKGDVYPVLQQKAGKEGLEEKVIFIPPQPYKEMLQYTLNADCGLSLDKPTNLNYRYSLPNKLFDYIKCGIPVLASDVIEVSNIVQRYGLGEIIGDHKPDTIISIVEDIRRNGKDYYRKGLKKAAIENSWEKEREKLIGIFKDVSFSPEVGDT